MAEEANLQYGLRRLMGLLALAAMIFGLSGCYAPLVTEAIPASTLPDEFRVPWRTGGAPLNLSTLTMTPPRDYLLGPNDILEVTIPGLYEQAEVRPLRVQVMADGQVHLPLVGSISVRDMNLVQAQRAFSAAYARGFIIEPRISVVLAEKSTTSVLVLGQVKQPGTYALPKYENDIGHALGAAFGLTEGAADYIEVHRQLQFKYHVPAAPPPFHSGDATPAPSAPVIQRIPPVIPADGVTRLPPMHRSTTRFASYVANSDNAVPKPVEQTVDSLVPQILRIPLRSSNPNEFNPQDIVLAPGDVVVVPDRRHEVFYVVGALNTTNTVRFTVGNRERELGVGFVLPRDREIDVVTAVAMAGYIDPIYSPTTVTVHRLGPDCQPMLIHVDLIKARYDRCETVLVQPGDIIYLNPDHAWWFRRFLDRVLVDAFSHPYRRLFR